MNEEKTQKKSDLLCDHKVTFMKSSFIFEAIIAIIYKIHPLVQQTTTSLSRGKLSAIFCKISKINKVS